MFARRLLPLVSISDTSRGQRLVRPKVLDASTPGFDTTRACRIKEWENLYSGSQAFLNPAAEPSRALAGHEERPWQRCIRSAAHQEHSVPWFWPLAAAIELGEEGMRLFQRNLDSTRL